MKDDLEQRINKTLRTSQKVFLACSVGAIYFLGQSCYGLVSRTSGMAPVAGIPVAVVGLVLAMVFLWLSFAIKKYLLRAALRRAEGQPDATSDLLAQFLNANICAAALSTGTAFAVGVFAFLMGPAGLPWMAGGLIPFAALAVHFPTREKLDAFLGGCVRSPAER